MRLEIMIHDDDESPFDHPSYDPQADEIKETKEALEAFRAMVNLLEPLTPKWRDRVYRAALCILSDS